jgi:UDPglucose 6-dehydrogenase
MSTRIAVIGAWHNAFVTAAGLAELGHQVILVHPEHKAWKDMPRLNIDEPGLNDLVRNMVLADRLDFGTMRRDGQLDVALSEHHEDIRPWPHVIWLAVDTALADDDSPLTAPLFNIIHRVHETRETSQLLIVGSQVPVGFCREVNKAHPALGLVCVPENYQLGRALDVFRNPDRIVIGGFGEAQGEVSAILRNISGFAERAVYCTWETAEMIKHATNAFLATSISLANELASVSAFVGADAQLVARAMKMDSRIGARAYVRPGLGFAGGTLPRDLRALQIATDESPVHLPLINAVLKVNDNVVEYIADEIVAMGAEVACIMGYTYKADTDALRRSPARELLRKIESHPAWCGHRHIVGYDPRMHHKTDAELAEAGMAERHLRVGLDAVPEGKTVYVVITPLREFRAMPWKGRANSVVFDLCDGVDKKAVLAAGMSYKAIWQPMEKP